MVATGADISEKDNIGISKKVNQIASYKVEPPSSYCIMESKIDVGIIKVYIVSDCCDWRSKKWPSIIIITLLHVALAVTIGIGTSRRF